MSCVAAVTLRVTIRCRICRVVAADADYQPSSARIHHQLAPAPATASYLAIGTMFDRRRTGSQDHLDSSANPMRTDGEASVLPVNRRAARSARSRSLPRCLVHVIAANRRQSADAGRLSGASQSRLPSFRLRLLAGELRPGGAGSGVAVQSARRRRREIGLNLKVNPLDELAAVRSSPPIGSP